jgi:hypothetical protein
VVSVGSQLGSAGEDEITGEDRSRGRPTGIQGGITAAQQGSIDQIIVNQGGIVKQFNRGSKGDNFVVGCTQHLPGEQAKRRADTFAA